jgi:SET domain-containing protein
VGKIVYKEQDNKYGMRIADMDLWIDRTRKGCPAKYMNHLCKPICNLEQWAIGGLPHMCFFANEDIKSGKELTFDYDWELKAVSKGMFKKSAMRCKCGKPKCHKYIERMKLPKNAEHVVKRARTL